MPGFLGLQNDGFRDPERTRREERPANFRHGRDYDIASAFPPFRYNRGRMLSLLKAHGVAILFTIYCAGVGTYLLLRPWAPESANASPYLKGFVSGIGLIHLMAGFHDLRALFRDLASHGEGKQ
jgi:hypothetical protein